MEQFSIAHDKGSSHGLSRIIRLAYHEHGSYVPLLRSAFQLWRELEAETGQVCGVPCRRAAPGAAPSAKPRPDDRAVRRSC
jgi:glycine/D-amino acid oxidase-like deaminating enzyme